jgi:integrase
MTGRRKTAYHSFKGTKREAEKKLAELITAAEKGEYVEPSKLTLGAYVSERVTAWERAGRITPKTAERYQELVNNQVTPHLGGLVMQKAKPSDIEAWHTTLKSEGSRRAAKNGGKRGISPATIRHAHRVVSKALKEAVKNGLVHRNVAALESPPKAAHNSNKMVIVTAEHMPDFVAKLRGHWFYPRAITALFTGLRSGELLALRWPNIDIDKVKVIRVREALEQTKKGGIRVKEPKRDSSIRDVTLPDIVIEALRDERDRQRRIAAGVPEGAEIDLSLIRLPDSALVFPAIDGGYSKPIDFSKAWARFAEEIGMPEITFHALRHTHASQLIDRKVDIVTIAARLGHKSPAITLQVYSHLFKKDDGKATEQINAAIAELGIG